jgi:hypothetical protein
MLITLAATHARSFSTFSIVMTIQYVSFHAAQKQLRFKERLRKFSYVSFSQGVFDAGGGPECLVLDSRIAFSGFSEANLARHYTCPSGSFGFLHGRVYALNEVRWHMI